MDKDIILQEKEAEVQFLKADTYSITSGRECQCMSVYVFCVSQLRRMQEMIAKMQAQMLKQDGDGDQWETR